MVGLKLLITPEFIVRKSAAPLQTAQTGISLGHKMWSRLLLPSCNNTQLHSPLSIEGCFTQFLCFYMPLITFISSKKYWTIDSVFIELLSVQYLVRKYKTNSNNKAVGGRNRFSTFSEPKMISNQRWRWLWLSCPYYYWDSILSVRIKYNRRV